MGTHDSSGRTPHDDQVGALPEAEHQRIRNMLTTVAAVVGRNVEWAPVNVLDVWINEHRMAAERRASTRLTRATWGLVVVTGLLAIGTLWLGWATLHAG